MDCPCPLFFGRPPCSPHFRFLPLEFVFDGKEFPDGGEDCLDVEVDGCCGDSVVCEATDGVGSVGCAFPAFDDVGGTFGFDVASFDAEDELDAKHADSADENVDVNGEVNGEEGGMTALIEIEKKKNERKKKTGRSTNTG